jgi:hypothetical protein
MSVQVLRKERGELDREQRFLAAHAAAHDRIYRYFRRRTDGPVTTEGLCSEVFKIVWEKSSREDGLWSWSFSELRPHHRFLLPAGANNGYLPPEFTAQDYLQRVADLGVAGGAVVSGSFQAFDQN